MATDDEMNEAQRKNWKVTGRHNCGTTVNCEEGDIVTLFVRIVVQYRNAVLKYSLTADEKSESQLVGCSSLVVSCQLFTGN